MNILYIDHYAGSLLHGMEFRPYYLAKEWEKLGHNVVILAGNYSHLRSKNPENTNDLQTEKIDGLTYCWVNSGAYQGNGARRALSMFRFVIKLCLNTTKITKLFKPEVVITSSTYPLDTYAGQKIARKSGAKLIHEVHDMWPATLTELGGMSSKHPFVKIMASAEKSFCKHSDEIVSMLPNTSDYFTEKGADPEHVHYISNGIVSEDWVAPEEIPELHRLKLEELQSANKFIVGYFGGHALSNSLDLLIEAASLSTNQNIHFVFVGDGVEKQRLINKSHELSLNNVTFLPPVPKKSVPILLNRFDVTVITGIDSPLYRFGSSLNKMFDAMKAAKPIIMAMDVAKNPIETCNCGTVVKDYSSQSLAEEIQRYANFTKDKLKTIGERGKSFVEQNFEYTVLAKKFADLFIK